VTPAPMPPEPAQTSLEVARRFVTARQERRALPGYPGLLPASLDIAYARQDRAIALWPDAVVGWKVGRIPDEWIGRLGEDRLMGPVFAAQYELLSTGDVACLSVIHGGFAAVEAEYVFVLARDADPRRADYSPAEALSLVGGLHAGIELAGSPLATINVLGPAVVVSDFGNNAGVFLGPEIPDWRTRDDNSLTCTTYIDGQVVGRGGAASLPGGPSTALSFALNRAARRGLPLKAGTIVSTGAATGIHDILPGQHARIVFDGITELHAQAVSAVRSIAETHP